MSREPFKRPKFTAHVGGFGHRDYNVTITNHVDKTWRMVDKYKTQIAAYRLALMLHHDENQMQDAWDRSAETEQSMEVS